MSKDGKTQEKFGRERPYQRLRGTKVRTKKGQEGANPRSKKRLKARNKRVYSFLDNYSVPGILGGGL